MSHSSTSSYKLLVNAEGGRVDAAILSQDQWVSSRSIQGNAVENLAPALRGVLSEASIRPNEIDTWIYSGGPGSLLGLRSLAMLLSTWETANTHASIRKLRYSGLVWAAREILHETPGEPFLLISPWRTNAWNILPVGKDLPTEADIQVFEGEPVAPADTSIYVLGERLRAKPPLGSIPIPFPTFDSLARHLSTPGFLTESEKVSPILSGTTEYKKWTPTIPSV